MDRLIYLIRHAESESNAGFRTKNAKDIHITEKGIKQSRAIVGAIIEPPERLIVSPYVLTFETASPFYLSSRFSVPRKEVWPVQEFTYLCEKRYADTTYSERVIGRDVYWKKLDPDYVEGL